MLIDGAANTTEYFYCHEQLTGVKFPDGSTRAAGFDNLNRQIWAVDERGVAVTNAYDKLDRLIGSAYIPFLSENDMPTARTVTPLPTGLKITTCDTSQIYGGFDNQNITYAYDKVGNVTNMTDWAIQITNAYDSLNRKITEYTDYKGNANLYQTIYSEYNLIDNRTKMRLIAPNDGLTNSYTYDNLNRLSGLYHESAKTINTSFVYNPNGKISGITNSTAYIYRQFAYDSEQRLSAINADYSGSDKLNLSYTYNNAQQIINIGETLNGTLNSYAFTYDNRDQLTCETCENVPTSYAYDLAQNRTSKTHNYSTPDTYSYVIANKLTNILFGVQNATNQYFYDIAGNLTSNVTNDKINYNFYNAQNKLVKITGPGFVYKFLYDSQNRRIGIAKGPNDSSLTWRYTIHDGNLPIGETDSSGEVNRWFVRGVGIAAGTGDMAAEIIGPDSGTAKFVYYLSNHRGDTLLAYRNKNGNTKLVAKYRYDAFGNQRSSYCVVYEPEYAPRYLFSTKEYLSDCQLYLYAYRVYDPVAGRWTQRDPIDYQDSVNLYQFCGNNPVNGFDEFGKVLNKMDDDNKKLFNENFPDERETAKELESASQVDKKIKNGWFKAVGDGIKAILSGGTSWAIGEIGGTLLKGLFGEKGERMANVPKDAVNVARKGGVEGFDIKGKVKGLGIDLAVDGFINQYIEPEKPQKTK